MTVPPDVFHRTLAYGERHGVANLNYADAANRIAGTNEGSGTVLSAANVGQYADQLDDNSTWKLTNHSPITWISVSGSDHDLDAVYHNGTPSTDHVVDVDEGKVVWRVSDTYGHRIETEAAGADVGFTDDDCEEVDMSSWTIDSGSAAKDLSNQRSGSRCITLDGLISKANVFTIGVEQTFGIWVKMATSGPTAVALIISNGTGGQVASFPAILDDAYHYYSVTFTPTDTVLEIETLYA